MKTVEMWSKMPERASLYKILADWMAAYAAADAEAERRFRALAAEAEGGGSRQSWLAHCAAQCERWRAEGADLQFHARHLHLKPEVGDSIEIYAAGALSTAAAAPGTLTFDVRFGSTVVFNGGASPTLATSATNLTWVLEITLKCRVIGASATVLGTGTLTSAALSATTPVMLLPTSAPAAGNTFDATSPQTLDLFGTWSVANASNSITCHQFEVIGAA